MVASNSTWLNVSGPYLYVLDNYGFKGAIRETLSPPVELKAGAGSVFSAQLYGQTSPISCRDTAVRYDGAPLLNGPPLIKMALCVALFISSTAVSQDGLR